MGVDVGVGSTQSVFTPKPCVFDSSLPSLFRALTLTECWPVESEMALLKYGSSVNVCSNVSSTNNFTSTIGLELTTFILKVTESPFTLERSLGDTI